MPVQSPDRPLQTFYKPAKDYYVGDVDLNFDADKLLFSSIGTHNRWQVFEIRMDGTGLRQVTPGEEPDIDNYDACYLPDGRIIFDSTSTFVGVPCVGGGDYVANLHLMNPDGTGIRRLCFDQDNDWYPMVLPNGRVMYLRWEYTDSAHYFSRVLMSMNPDGTGQTEVYESNSYWPNSHVLRAAAAGQPDEVRRDRFRPPRRAAHGRAGAVRYRQGPAGRHRGDAAHSRLRQTGQGHHQGRAGQRLLAEVPASVSAERQVFPGVLQADRRSRPGASTWWMCSTTCCC